MVGGSYKKIDYRIRPAKYAERQMMCDAFRRLKFGTVESYQYVGLGSVYFSDFALFHRALNISKMVSIEDMPEDEEQRFYDNLPFANIEILAGKTTTELDKIDLSLRTICWLDYDGHLERYMFDDLRSFITRAVSGSVLCVSVPCNGDRFDPAAPTKNVTKLVGRLGKERVPVDLTDAQLAGSGMAKLCRRVLTEEVAKTLDQRNGGLPYAQQLQAMQIFNFHYADNARMMTVGWVLVDRGQTHIYHSCAFENLEFVKTDADPFSIEIPRLTTRELRLLDATMPSAQDVEISISSIPSEEAKLYRQLYRYFPNVVFADQ